METAKSACSWQCPHQAHALVDFLPRDTSITVNEGCQPWFALRNDHQEAPYVHIRLHVNRIPAPRDEP
jgi:hypothetical protein